MDLSFCIVNWNTPHLTLQLIDSIHQTTPDITYEIIVVDNASTDDSVQRIAEKHPTVNLLALPTNIGYGAGMNAAFHVASGPYLLILNSDVVLLPGAVAHMLHFLQAHPEIGVVGGICVDENEQPVESYGYFPRPWRMILKNVSLVSLPKSLRPPPAAVTPHAIPSTPIDVEYVAGACMMIPAAVLETIGEFDEQFFAYYEETDLCKRMDKHGLKRYVMPQARLVHIQGQSFEQVPDLRKDHLSKGLYLYLNKHHGVLMSKLVYYSSIFKRKVRPVINKWLRSVRRLFPSSI